MTHEEAFMLMMDTLDKLAGWDEEKQLHDHLLRCTECAAEWEALQAVDGLLLSAPMAPAPEGFSARVMEQLGRPSWARTLGTLFALSIASVLALLVVAVPALLVLLVFSTAYTEPAQFTGLVMWMKDLASVAGTLLEGVFTTLRLFFGRAASTPAALVWAFAAAMAVALWAYLIHRLEPAPVPSWTEE
jgi:hypothetical protein